MFSEVRRPVFVVLSTAALALLPPVGEARAQCRGGGGQGRGLSGRTPPPTPLQGGPLTILQYPLLSTSQTTTGQPPQTALQTAEQRQTQLTDVLTALGEQMDDPSLPAARQRRLETTLRNASKKQQRQEALLTRLQDRQDRTGSLTAAQQRELAGLLVQQNAQLRTLQREYVMTQRVLGLATLRGNQP